MIKKKLILIGVIFLSLMGIVTADFGYNNKGLPALQPPINYSSVNVNNSEFWDGNAWSDTRWLNIDGSNANSNIDIGAYNLTTTGTFGAGAITGTSLTIDTISIDGSTITESTGALKFDVTKDSPAETSWTVGEREIVPGLFLPTLDASGIMDYGIINHGLYLGADVGEEATLAFGYLPTMANAQIVYYHLTDTLRWTGAAGGYEFDNDLRIYGANKKFYFGNFVASISYDGDDMIINPKEVGTGKLKVLGDLNVTGKIYNSLAHVFGLATETFTVAVIDTWYNISMNRSHADAVGFTFSEDNITIIVPHDGHYTITFGMGIMDSAALPSANVGMRIELNGAELKGSYIEDDTQKKDSDKWQEHTTHAELSEGDTFRLQYISSATTVTIEQEDTYATQGFSAFGYIQEVMT